MDPGPPGLDPGSSPGKGAPSSALIPCQAQITMFSLCWIWTQQGGKQRGNLRRAWVRQYSPQGWGCSSSHSLIRWVLIKLENPSWISLQFFWRRLASSSPRRRNGVPGKAMVLLKKENLKDFLPWVLCFIHRKKVKATSISLLLNWHS